MKYLFIHPGFPDRFSYLAQLLSKNSENQVKFITSSPGPEKKIPGVEKIIIPDFPPEEEIKQPGLKQVSIVYNRARATSRR